MTSPQGALITLIYPRLPSATSAVSIRNASKVDANLSTTLTTSDHHTPSKRVKIYYDQQQQCNNQKVRRSHNLFRFLIFQHETNTITLLHPP